MPPQLQKPPPFGPGRSIAAASFAAMLLLAALVYTPTFPSSSKLIALPLLQRDTLKLINPTRRTAPGNESCVIVGCYTPNTPGVQYYWHFYSRSGYAVTMYAMDNVVHNGQRVSDKWCDVPAAREELRRRPKSKVIYIDVDTRIDVRAWCNLPNHDAAPLIVNSLTRGPRGAVTDWYVVEGTQVQTNVFRAASGEPGLNALKRWEDSYQNVAFSDQGPLHMQEHGLCGVPGWIACYRNPEQQTCHCFGSGNVEKKTRCIAQLFSGMWHKCKMQ